MTDRDLQRAAERFADTVHEDVTASVRQAWALERDRLYAEIAELRDEVHTIAQDVRSAHWKADNVARRVVDLEQPQLHSVRVDP